ncbi:MAG: 2-phosphosulfolactate phosphatase, partial [Actinobacteria bacterium]|nr:2-phosphosulfolactate phosphatase [Actinomycetota bacterium]
MKVHTILTNDFDPGRLAELNMKESVCAVIDTIRATSTIATIIGCGGSNILIAPDKKEAYSLKNKFNDFLLCGEEKGLPPAGFDHGNSPIELSEIDCRGKNFILMTTNGTKSILKAKDCPKIYTLSILNLNSAVNAIIETAFNNALDIILLCSGERGKIAYDDAYTAGLAIKYILTKPYKFEF